MGGRADGLEAGQDGRLALLQQVNAHQHVAVAAQRATVRVVHLQRTVQGASTSNKQSGAVEKARGYICADQQQPGFKDPPTHQGMTCTKAEIAFGQ